MVIREAEGADLSRVVDLHLAVIAAMAGLAPPGYGETGIRQPADRKQVEEQMAEALESPACCLAVAEEDGALGGYLLCALEEHGDDLLDPPFATISYLSVDEAWRGRGLARALIGFAEDWARAQGVGSVDLLVWANNQPARRLYEELGYETLELRMARKL